MRSTVILTTLCGIAFAAPKPQGIEVDAIKNLKLPDIMGPDPEAASAPPVTYNPTSAASAAAAAIETAPVSNERRAIDKRADACAPEPTGTGPVPGNGSVEAYLDQNNLLAQSARAAGTPSGYTKSFTNLQNSTEQIGFLTYKTLPNNGYDVNGCAAFCNSIQFCVAFNIYYERDPSITPAAACPNPFPVTNLKCALFGYPVTSETAMNSGQFRGPKDSSGEAFHVVIAGSNGYSRAIPPPTLLNFTGPSSSLNGAINAPLDGGIDTYLGMKLYNDGPYDPSQCAAACQAQTAYDRRHANPDGTYKPCNFFNSYVLSRDNVPQGTYCSFYTRRWADSYATNTGYTSNGTEYKVNHSYTYFLTIQDPGHI